MEQEKIKTLLEHYADPFITCQDGVCGQCEKQLTQKVAAIEELAKPLPSLDAFMRRSAELWNQSRHYKTFKEIESTLPDTMDPKERLDKIFAKMRESGLEP